MLSTRPPLDSPTAPLIKPLMAGGALLLAVVVLGQGQSLIPSRSTSTAASTETCEAIIRSDARLSRDQLAKLLTIPERDTKENVRKVVSEPYCRLASMEVRAGVKSEREIYPLAFDPTTQLILLYEGDEYAGYRFKVN
ncbi:hypothetical protein [Phormidium sp. FACHB-1136]|uniref:hypothetical protein n=1 Tax=Phormidium sp. FACHB-1136 TaxID=2692848 RepID=UPI0016859E8A|nr:hypothetical protein [Phormidium sp. FACHB-1136]MBD2426088.1 hypothetical protein [Phormidium sp. FACHB-1136]